MIRETSSGPPVPASGITIQELYGLLVADKKRNEQIFNGVLLAMEEGRSPILLTERKEHLEHLHQRLKRFVRHIVILQGGRSKKERREVEEQLASIPVDEQRLLLATGRYTGEIEKALAKRHGCVRWHQIPPLMSAGSPDRVASPFLPGRSRHNAAVHL